MFFRFSSEIYFLVDCFLLLLSFWVVFEPKWQISQYPFMHLNWWILTFYIPEAWVPFWAEPPPPPPIQTIIGSTPRKLSTKIISVTVPGGCCSQGCHGYLLSFCAHLQLLQFDQAPFPPTLQVVTILVAMAPKILVLATWFVKKSS